MQQHCRMQLALQLVTVVGRKCNKLCDKLCADVHYAPQADLQEYVEIQEAYVPHTNTGT